MKKKFIVVGAGITGLILAQLIQKKTKSQVIVIDAASTPGGLFQSSYYPEFGYFDRGVHIFQDTGVNEIEAVIRGSLPESEWQDLIGYKREIAGLFFNGRLQTNSAFLDFRDHTKRAELFGGMLQSLNAKTSTNKEYESFSEMMCEKFGAPIFDNIIRPIAEGIYGRPVDELQKLAATLTPFERVIFFDEENMTDLMRSDLIRARLGFPEQKNLPLKYSSGLKSYYPKKFGLQKVVDNMVKSILENGGEIHLNTKITNINVCLNRINSMQINKLGCSSSIDDIDSCMWTAPLPTLFGALGGAKLIPVAYDPPPETWILNLACSQAPKMSDLYFFYSYLAGGRAFRISNPLGYSSHMSKEHEKYFPLCVEAIFPHGNELTTEGMTHCLVSELERMGILSKEMIVFSDLLRSSSGVPMPTIKNAKAITQMRAFISNMNIGNLLLTGIQAEPDLFFYRDILRYSHKKLNEFWQ